MRSRTTRAEHRRSGATAPRIDRSLGVALLSLLGGGACGGAPSTAPVVELPAASAEVSGAPSEAAAGPLAAEALLARLPRGAAAYVALRPSDYDPPLAPLLAQALRDGGIGRLFGEARGIGELLEALHVDASRPIFFAASAPTRGDGAELIDMLATDTRWEELAPRVEAMAPIASSYRVVVPLEPGVDASTALRAMFQRLHIETTPCPGDRRCERFGRERPSFLVVRAPWLGAVFVEGASAELELARTRLWRADLPSTWELLVDARRTPRGGPEPGRCAAELASAAWLCVDADRFAAHGAAEGNLSVADALSGFGFDPGERARIASQGRDEIARIAELARPRRPLLDGVSASLRFDGERYTFEARWRTTALSRAGVERALGTRHCGTIGEPAPFYAALRAAFPDPGPEFADPSASRERLMEAGWGGQGVAFARSWPNLLALAPGDVQTLARELGVGEACASYVGGELSLSLRGRAPWGGEP